VRSERTVLTLSSVKPARPAALEPLEFGLSAADGSELPVGLGRDADHIRAGDRVPEAQSNHATVVAPTGVSRQRARGRIHARPVVDADDPFHGSAA
jgi:hypothetical protein